MPPEEHVSGGPLGELQGERSAGFIRWVDGAAAITVRNLASSLYLNMPETAARFIRLGSLYSEDARAGIPAPDLGTSGGVGGGSRGEVQNGAVVVRRGGSGGGDRGGGGGPIRPASVDERTTSRRDRDSFTYSLIVGLDNHAIGFEMPVPKQRAVATRALHLAETGQHDAVAAVSSSIKNAWLRHSVRATNSGVKQTMKTYRPCFIRFCEWDEGKLGDWASVMPVSRNVVVAFLEAEKLRCVSGRKCRREEDDSSDADSIEDADVVPCAHPQHPAPIASATGRSGGPALSPASSQHMIASPGRSTRAGSPDGASVTTRAPMVKPPQPRVGPMVLTHCLKAVSNIGSLFNLLWSGSSCEHCSRWRVDEYTSVGSLPPAVSVVG